MSYESKLFGTIPYKIKNSDHAIYAVEVVEHALLDFYDDKASVKADLIKVVHDHKHEANVLHVFTHNTDAEIWEGSIEDDLYLRFQAKT